MGDLLIRNIDDGLKRQLQESARQSGRSISDEAIDILRKQIGFKHSAETAGSRFRSLLGPERLSDNEVAAIAEFRKVPDRDPPKFDK